MKRILNHILLIAAVPALLICGSCNKYLDINKNPNAATSATPELVLPGAINATAAQLNPIGFPNTVFSGWMGQWAISGSYAISASDFTTYKQTTQFGDGTWQTIYDNLNDYNYVEVQSKAQNKYFYVAAAKVMKAFNFQELVDLFNNVPYSEAFNGTKVIHPKYDDGKSIYLDLIKQLDTAIAYFKRNDAVGDVKSDILFDGDNGKWIRFANTLKLRILMRQSKAAGQTSYVQSEIAKIITEGSGFLGAGEDAAVNPGYFNSAGEANPFWGGNYNVAGTYVNDFWRANQYGIDFYKNENDPRLTLVYGPTPSDATKYQGNKIGQIGGLVGSASSVFGPGVLKSYSQDAIIMTAAESFFLQAEASLYGWIPGNQQQALYQQGVTESFRLYGVPSYAAAATTYYNQDNDKNVNWSATTTQAEQLALIIRQKWAAMNTITPIEAYDDYRRLGLPADIPLSLSPYVDVLKIPYRFLYPLSEYKTNSDAVAAQGAIDHHTSKVFWMP
jgi:hypothetical protein